MFLHKDSNGFVFDPISLLSVLLSISISMYNFKERRRDAYKRYFDV